MSARILHGKEFAAKIEKEVRAQVECLKRHWIVPGLAVVIVGDDPASQVYVSNKHRKCHELGIQSLDIAFPATVSKEELLDKIHELNDNELVNGILVQMPLPPALESAKQAVIEAIDPAKDVDGFHPVNTGLRSIGEEAIVPCTPAGCVKMLDLAGIPIEGARAVTIGRSTIVGRPMNTVFLNRNATPTLCHSHTRHLAQVTREADILVAAVGKPRFVTADMVKPGATVIDVGINRIAVDGGKTRLVGDVDFDAVKEVAGAITPVPGGVGLLTIAMLMSNTVRATAAQNGVAL